jgi:hypothetical protein
MAIDPGSVDPRAILAAIAGDARAGAGARGGLQGALGGGRAAAGTDERADALRNRVTARAVEIARQFEERKSTDADGPISCVERYRGVGIHDCQPAERIERVVKPEIALVLDQLHDVEALYAFASDFLNAPEARSLAAVKIKAQFALVVEERRARPTKIKHRVGGNHCCSPQLSQVALPN